MCTETQGPVLSCSTVANYLLGWRIILLVIWTNYGMEIKFGTSMDILEEDGYIQHLFLVFHFFPALSKLYNHASTVSPCAFSLSYVCCCKTDSFLWCLQFLHYGT